MKTFVAVCLLACAAAFPQNLDLLEGSGEPPVEIAARSSGLDNIYSDDILRSEFEMSDDGQFQYGFETRDGTVVDAAGENRQIGDAAGIAMRGSYSYTSPEGIAVTIDWVADEAGFRASGPQVPKVPEYVTQLLKSLPVVPQPAVEVSSSEDGAAAPVELVVPAEPAVEVISSEDAAVEVSSSEDAAVEISSSEDAAVAPAEPAVKVSSAEDAAVEISSSEDDAVESRSFEGAAAVPVVAAPPAVVVADEPPVVIPDESEFIVLSADSEAVKGAVVIPDESEFIVLSADSEAVEEEELLR